MNYLNNSSCNGDSSLQLNNVEILYTKVQRVYVKPQHKEERQRELRVNVEIHAGISPVCRKSLCVLLADDDDPCFLYSLFITEEDFKVLKSQQGLLVDFDNFATQLIHLLGQCQFPSTTTTTSVTKTPPKFLLLLAEENGEWVFKLVETNNFKHLCHLSLIISPASDSDLKTHMAMKIKRLKENLTQRDREASSLEARLNDLTSKIETKTRELEQLEQKYAAEKSQMQLSSSEQISLEKDRFAKARLEWQCQTEKEKIEAERRHTNIVKELHTELAELRTQNLTYKEKISLLEATNIEQFKQLQNVEKELNVTQRDLSLLRTQNSKLDTDYHEKDKMVNSLRTKVAVLEQELKDKGLLITKHTEMFKTAKEQKQQLEELLNEKEGQLQRKQNSLRNLSDELVKANEILTKLQNELASTKSKLKLRTSIALEQERLLDTKQKEMGQLENKMEGLTKETKDAKMEVENLKEQLKALQCQLEEKEKTIKNNDNVISWLNRRLADNQSPQLQNVGTSVPITVPSTTIQLTLPRTNKYISNNKYETRTPAPVTVQTSGLTSRNPIVQNPNINQTSRPTARSTAVGNNIVDSVIGISTFNKGGHISSTSTPLERINSLNKLPGNVGAGSSSMPATENNNMANNNGTKNKVISSSNFQGVSRRMAGFTGDKPILPSAYFPKTLH